MPNLKTVQVLCLAGLLAGCGAELSDNTDSDTDDLSASTFSMEMVRQNPALLPGVKVPDGVRVNGHPRPLPADEQGTSFRQRGEESNWLYTANQLGRGTATVRAAATSATATDLRTVAVGIVRAM